MARFVTPVTKRRAWLGHHRRQPVDDAGALKSDPHRPGRAALAPH
ncbi:hypothetical protein CBM2625_B180059 [Cupriavidus taiwanensis]|nr:hypothetical protein CBM2625_B180059 [Cupriavidus taiwanensis]